MLFHGTLAQTAMSCAQMGLLPRSDTKAQPHHPLAASHAGMVYLSDGHALSFANLSGGMEDGRAIVAVDADGLASRDLFPDEDFLAEINAGNQRTGTTDWYRENLSKFKGLARRSLREFGTIAHRGPIPVDIIKRITILDPDESDWFNHVSPPLPSTQITAAERRAYRNLTMWLTGYDDSADTFLAYLQRSEPIMAMEFEREIEHRLGVHTYDVIAHSLVARF